MNDQPTSDALSRASAYLDGELEAGERAAAEADPAVMAEVARLRSLQSMIRDAPAPTSHARETAITAALAEYDRKRHPAPVIRTKPRPAYTRWLAVAAAVAGLAALGAVVATNGRGGDDDDSASLASAEESGVAFDANAADRATSAGGAPAPEATQSQTMIASGTGAPAATEMAAGDAASAAAAEAPASTAAAGIAESSPAPFDPDTPIPDELELGRVGRQLLAEWTAGARESKVGTPCDATGPDIVLLSDALLIVQGVARPVLIAGNPTDNQVTALDPDTCVVVATGR
jgi:hypothetical protein